MTAQEIEHAYQEALAELTEHISLERKEIEEQALALSKEVDAQKSASRLSELREQLLERDV